MIWFFIPTDKSRIRKLIGSGSAAIEQEDLESVMSRVSYNYRDDYGMTYLYLKESLKRFFKRYNNINIHYSNLHIQVNGHVATAGLDVRVLVGEGKDRGYIAGNTSGALHIVFSLEKEKFRWQIVKTEGVPTNYF